MRRARDAVWESIAKDAASSERKSAQERVQMFVDLMETIEEITQSISTAERARRQAIADELQRRPNPWWQNFRPEALAEYQCQVSSS